MNKKILIIDDSNEFSFLMESLFKFHKLDVVSEVDSKKGETLSTTEKFDVVIVDYMMGPPNGLEVAKAIRDGSVNSKVPIIVLTAKQFVKEEMEQLNELELIYIRKPIMPKDLFRKITELLK